jgi:hypothetical protein
VGLAVLLAACGGSDGTPEGQISGPTPEPTIDLAARGSNISGEEVGIGGDDRVLVWIGEGSAPGTQTNTNPGRLATINARGSIEIILELFAGTFRVLPCGDQATSSDGRYFAFFVGGDDGSLYLMDGIRTPTAVTQMGAMGCGGGGWFRFSPDAERFAYIDFPPEAVSAALPTGVLYVHETGSRDSIAQFENAAAFDLSAGLLGFVSLFTDSQARATEAAVFLWERGDAVEVATLYAEDGCTFTSAQIAILTENRLAAVMGRRCNSTGSGWMLYTIDVAEGRATLTLADRTTGAFYTEARTNTLFTSPDGGVLYYSLPDGLARSTAQFRQTAIDDIQPGENILTNAVMPRFSNRPYGISENAALKVSPDDRWLAVVTNTANNVAAINVVDLAAPDLPPITIPAGSPGDVISSMAFTADSQRLLYVAGGHSAADNSLFSLALDAESGDAVRVSRGRYWHVVASPDGGAAALSEWQVPEDRNEPDYLNLVVVSIANNQSATLFTGAELIEGEVENQLFVYPLAWRRG